MPLLADEHRIDCVAAPGTWPQGAPNATRAHFRHGLLALLWSLVHIAKSLLAVPGGLLADRLGRRTALGLGWLLAAAVYAAFAAGVDGGWLVGVFLLLAASHGLTEGTVKALVVSQASTSGAPTTGSALGAFHLVSGLAGVLASLWFGLVWELAAPAIAFACAASFATIATAALAVAGRRAPAARPARDG